MRREVVAVNDATRSENKMHDDGTARTFGFSGGLVPGVNVHAYLCWGPVAAWGPSWLERGTMSARYRKPVYDGATVVLDFAADSGECRVLGADGTVLATGSATLPDRAPALPDLAAHPEAPLPDERPDATPDTLRPGRVMGTWRQEFPDDVSGDYLTVVGEESGLYAAEHIAHPGWLLRLANRSLAANVRLGPWIHAGTTVQNLGIVRAPAVLSSRATVAREYERAGHRFVELDLVVVDEAERPVLSAVHTSIYRPRQVAAAV
jgi:hypothetical protein